MAQDLVDPIVFHEIKYIKFMKVRVVRGRHSTVWWAVTSHNSYEAMLIGIHFSEGPQGGYVNAPC